MSSNFGAVQPLMDQIQKLRMMGRSAVNTVAQPIQAGVHGVESLLGIPQPQAEQHEQAISQMNRGLNDERVQEANRSFQPNLATMKKPLGK